MIYIGIGSNLGHRLNYLRRAVSLLKARFLSDIKCSIILETEAILPKGAKEEWNKPYLNMVVSGSSNLAPELLLQQLQQIEIEVGRPKHCEKWAPRVIDLDILLWDNVTVNKDYLKIPHPEINNRPFLIHLLTMMGGVKKTQIPDNCFVKSFTISPNFVGIVNITSDSFSDGGLFNNTDKATQQVLTLVSEGASIIEIGAQSTRPGAVIHGPEREYLKLKPVLDNLMPLMENGLIKISVDSFWPAVIRKILEHYPISWVNDVKGDFDDDTLRLITQRKCSLCIMHSLDIPARKDIVIPNDRPPIDIIMDWASKNIEHLLSLGFNQESIIIDPGIGFSKSPYQDIELMRHAGRLKSLGSPILIGHSRKSYIESFAKQPAKNRDLETIAISALLADKVDFLRIHNVTDHMRFFVAQQALQLGDNE